MATLYELTAEMQELLEMAEDEELDPQTIADTLEGVEGEFEAKADGYAAVLRELEGKVDFADTEIDRMEAHKKVLKSNQERIKTALQNAMIATGKTKFRTGLFGFSIQKNAPALDKVIEDAVPAEFFILQEPKLDRKALLTYAKAHPEEAAPFATVKQTESLRIR